MGDHRSDLFPLPPRVGTDEGRCRITRGVRQLTGKRGKSVGFDALIIGLVYASLPLIRKAAFPGFQLAGCDLDINLIEQLNLGRSHISDVPDFDIAGTVNSGQASRGQYPGGRCTTRGA